MDSQAEVSKPGQSTGPAVGMRWYVAFLCFLTFLCAAIDRHILGLLVEPIVSDLGISDAQFGLLAGGSFLLFYLFGSIPAGWLVDRKSRPKLLAMGVAVWSSATILIGLVGGLWQIFLLRSLVGLGEAIVSPATNSIVSDLFPKRHMARALSLISLGSALGAGMIALLGALLFSLDSSATQFMLPLFGPVQSWQTVFLAAGLPGLILAPLIWLTVKDPERRRVVKEIEKEGDKFPLSKLYHFFLENKKICIMLFVGFSGFSVVNSSMVLWAPSYFIRSHNLSIIESGYIIGITYLSVGIVSFFINSVIIDRGYAKGDIAAPLRLARNYAFMGVFPAIALILTKDLLLAKFALGAFIFFNSGFFAVSIALPRLFPNHLRGQFVASYLIAFQIVGGMGGPLLIGVLSDNLEGEINRIGISLGGVGAVMFLASFGVLHGAIKGYIGAATNVDRLTGADLHQA